MKKLMAICKNVWQRFNWCPNFVTWIELFLAAMIVPVLIWTPNPHWFAENGVVENIQLAILVGAIVIAFCAKYNRSLFVFAAFVALFMITRETNMFRDIFCAYYIPEDGKCKWTAFEYGYIVPGIRWLFVLYVLYYVWRHRLWNIVGVYVCKAPVFVWDLLLLSVMIVGGTLAEFPCVDSEILEESCELIAYIALANCIWRYSKWREN